MDWAQVCADLTANSNQCHLLASGPSASPSFYHLNQVNGAATTVSLLSALLNGNAFFFFSSRRRHTRSTRDWSSTCALPIFHHEVRKLKFGTPEWCRQGSVRKSRMKSGAQIVYGGGWLTRQTIGRPKTRAFTFLSLIWLGVSLCVLFPFWDGWP